MGLVLWIILGILAILLFSGIRIVRPTERAVIETLGKYSRCAGRGFNWIVPIIQRMIVINITEQMSDIEPQEIITKDNLNANADLVVFYKINDDEESVKKALYNVNDVEEQLKTLARTTARNVIGNLVFRDVNSKRNDLNQKLAETMDKETKTWGVRIVRVELKEINPPKDVQETMNKVIKAENEKEAAIDFATAVETKADGERRAKIKEAEGTKQKSILEAQGKAEAFNLVNKSFVGNAQLLKKLEVTQASLENNSKVVLTKDGISPQIILGEIPLKNSK
jgi:regulator of protease activity HflC (stomatin/prohibitin superfamily)